VPFLYKCRRSATIKAVQYATLGKINHKIMNQLLFEFPNFKSYL